MTIDFHFQFLRTGGGGVSFQTPRPHRRPLHIFPGGIFGWPIGD
nr:MAG TPA: hypothetical protein [Caudoviricetes sp.]